MLWKTVNGAFLSQVEREWLKDTACAIAQVFDSPLFLNIGIFKGASMHCLRAGALDAELVGVDKTIRKLQGSHILNAEFICGDTRYMSWDRPIHLLFVDGGHRYEIVKSDIKNFGPHVVPGGIIAVHDYNRSESFLEERRDRRPNRCDLGVRQAVDELFADSHWWAPLEIIDSIKAFRRLQ